MAQGDKALKRATEYAKSRHVFGQPIGKNQAIQHPLAQTWCALEAAKMLALHASKRFDEIIGTGHLETKEATVAQREEVGALCNAAKYLAAEAAFDACERSVMAHGGMVYASDFLRERYLRSLLSQG